MTKAPENYQIFPFPKFALVYLELIARSLWKGLGLSWRSQLTHDSQESLKFLFLCLCEFLHAGRESICLHISFLLSSCPNIFQVSLTFSLLGMHLTYFSSLVSCGRFFSGMQCGSGVEYFLPFIFPKCPWVEVKGRFIFASTAELSYRFTYFCLEFRSRVPCWVDLPFHFVVPSSFRIVSWDHLQFHFPSSILRPNP